MTAEHNNNEPASGGRIRVVHVLEATTGGTARHLRELVARTDPGAFELSVICSLQRDSTFAAAIAGMRARGVRVTTIPMRRQPRPISDLLARRAIIRELTRNPVDIVHTHSAKAGFLGRLAAHRVGALKAVYTPHGFPFQMTGPAWLRALYRALESRAAAWTDTTICVSREETRCARALSHTPPHIAYIPNGVEVPETVDKQSMRSNILQELSLPADALLVGAVGRLTQQKGLEHLVGAAALLTEQLPATHFLIVGDGEESPRLQTLVQRGALGRRIHFLGPRDDAAALAGGMDVIAMPSLWEGLPYTLLDTMARGVPVVGSRIGGIPDVILDGETGLLVPPGETRPLADALLSVLQDDPLRRRLGSAARTHVGGHFTLDRMIKETEAVYRRAVTGLADPGRMR